MKPETPSATAQAPLGYPVPDWQGCPAPAPVTLEGCYCRLEPLSAVEHAEALFAAYAEDVDGGDWTYLPVGPFASLAAYRTYLLATTAATDPLHFLVRDRVSGRALGTFALMRQQPAHGVLEVGYVAFAPVLQRSRLGTEAHFLLMAHVFETLGYRRYEWKCDSLNARSRQAALRLGFTYEGCFRQAMVYKGRNRDTAWFSILDREWPALRAAFLAWLDDGNFDARGQQQQRLETLRTQLSQEDSP